jgi:hypothetical protein
VLTINQKGVFLMVAVFADIAQAGCFKLKHG